MFSHILKDSDSNCSYGINTKESPMIGLYPLNNASTLVETPAELEAYFSEISTVVPTTLPNFLVPTPTFSTPPYLFNASVTAFPGEIVASGLATSTYAAVLEPHHLNASGIGVISPSPTRYTFLVTGPAGQVSTSISTVAAPSVALGTPPGWTGAASPTAHPHTFFVALLALLCSTIFFYCI